MNLEYNVSTRVPDTFERIEFEVFPMEYNISTVKYSSTVLNLSY